MEYKIYIERGFRSVLRSIARSMLLPRLRIWLLRQSGIIIGSDTYINMHVNFIDNYREGAIQFNERIAVAPHATFIAESDPNYSRLGLIESFVIKGKILVKDDAWIGANAIIFPNITIGKCSVVGAGSVITKDVEDYAIVVGNPARKISDVREKFNTDSWRDINCEK